MTPTSSSILSIILFFGCFYKSLAAVANNRTEYSKNKVMKQQKQELDAIGDEHSNNRGMGGVSGVEKFEVNLDHLSNIQCDQDTFQVQKKLMAKECYVNLIQKIQESGRFDLESNSYVVVDDRYLNASFQSICEDNGGQMISADVSYGDKLSICNEKNLSGVTNYSSYPICLARFCEERSKLHTVVGVLTQNLIISKVVGCDPEVFIKENDYHLYNHESASSSCLRFDDEDYDEEEDSSCHQSLGSKMYYY